MSIWGEGLLAIWSELDPNREDDFDAWHIHEHLPERVLVPGFLRARRYVRFTPPPTNRALLLTLYETESVGVMASAPYIERLNNPTPLTRQTVPLMENMRRAALRRSASLGQGLGGYVTAWSFRAVPGDTVTRRQVESLLSKAMNPVGVIACHLFEPEVEATRAKDATAEGMATRTAEEAPQTLLLIEATHERALTEAQHLIANDMATLANDDDATIEGYRLSVVLNGPTANPQL